VILRRGLNQTRCRFVQADAIGRAPIYGAAVANGGSCVQSLSAWRRSMNDDTRAQTGPASEIVLFKNGDTNLRIGRDTNGTFELVLSVHGEEITAYDLTADAVAAIGTKLVTAAGRA
jgi:hypothetical protein